MAIHLSNKINNSLHKPKRILLGQLNSFGDCMYATTLAKQIKKDFPECNLTWAIGSMCRSIIDGNPFVDNVWEVPLRNIEEVNVNWGKFEEEALERKKQGIFDEVFFTQIAPNNLHLYDGSIRCSIFRGYPYQINVSIEPVLRLSSTEIENVRRFSEFHQLQQKKHIILFETSPQSGQSFLNLDIAQKVADKIISSIPDSCIILSSNIHVISKNKAIIDGSELTLRENAELTNYCTLLVGGSSGISWICTSDWAKPLPMIQLLKSDAMWFNSIVKDHELWGLPSDSIIEMKECSADKVYQCITTVLEDGFDKAKPCYHEAMKIPLGYFKPILFGLLKASEFKKALGFSVLNIKKYGLLPQFFMSFLSAMLHVIAQKLKSKFSYGRIS